MYRRLLISWKHQLINKDVQHQMASAWAGLEREEDGSEEELELLSTGEEVSTPIPGSYAELEDSIKNLPQEKLVFLHQNNRPLKQECTTVVASDGTILKKAVLEIVENIFLEVYLPVTGEGRNKIEYEVTIDLGELEATQIGEVRDVVLDYVQRKDVADEMEQLSKSRSYDKFRMIITESENPLHQNPDRPLVLEINEISYLPCEKLEKEWSTKLIDRYNNHSFDWVLYKQCRDICFRERKIGLSRNMNELYRFWEYMLFRDLDIRLYKDFRDSALLDASNNDRHGIEYLFHFYSYVLGDNFTENLYEEFKWLVEQDFERGFLYGLKKFYEFLFYSSSIEVLNMSEKMLHYLCRFSSLAEFGKYLSSDERNQSKKLRLTRLDLNPRDMGMSEDESVYFGSFLSSIQKTDSNSVSSNMFVILHRIYEKSDPGNSHGQQPVPVNAPPSTGHQLRGDVADDGHSEGKTVGQKNSNEVCLLVPQVTGVQCAQTQCEPGKLVEP